MLGQSIFAANAEIKTLGDYEFQSMNVHPGSVVSQGWGNPESALIQEIAEDALFNNFNRDNSAKVEKFEPVVSEIDNSNETPVTIGTETETVSDPTPVEVIEPESPQAPVTVEETLPVSDGGDASSQADTQASEPEQIPEQEPTPEPILEPVPEPEVSTGESSLQSLSKSFFRFALRATQMLPFAQESIVTPVSEPEPASEPVVQESQPEEGVQMDVAPDIIPELTPDRENQDGASTDNTVENLEPEELLTTEEKNGTLCDKSKCYEHVLEFGDFSVGETLEDQQITNMQLRVSLGARSHENAVLGEERIRVEYLHYDYWIDGGEIVINDEVSNAINGGYYLFAFPLYSEWDEMSRIKVRFTYLSDGEHLANIFLDSVWLEVESIHKNALIDPAAMNGEELSRTYREPIREGVPEGYSIDVVSEKSEFTHDEIPHFDFDLRRAEQVKVEGFFERVGNRVLSFFGLGEAEQQQARMRLRVANGEFKGIAKITENEDGSFALDIPKKRQFKPGRHVVTVEVTDGDTVFYIDKEFMWGVLALNTDKSIYLPEEEAYLQMGVLDDLGHTICDAKLDLEITNPLGETQYLSTDTGTINFGNECAGDTYTTSPDYDADYTFRDGTGIYEMKLTAVTENGTHTITDKVEVRESVPFDIVRTGPTRIYPPELYPVTLTITANQDYSGEVVELVPVSFNVYERNGLSFRTHEVGDVKQLIWNVDMKAGETTELSYRFDAPDISPEFYLLGPLTIGSFAEIRDWQIASDAPSNATVVQSVMGTQVSASSYSATFGSAPTNGNTIIMVAMHRDGAEAFNAPASYLTQAVLSNASVQTDIGIWYAPANSASTTYTITKTGGNQTGVVFLMEVSGLDTTNLLNATSSNDETGTTGLVSFTGLTATTTPYAFAVAASGFSDNDFTAPTSASWTSSSSATYTQRSQLQWATGNDGLFAIATANIISGQRQGARLALTVGGVETRNSVLAVFRLRPQVNTVGARGNQTSEMKISTANNYVGGAFTIATDNGTTSVTSITVSEAGTTDASADVSNIRLYYELDTTNPYDCASVSYGGNETQYGATSSAFSSANGISTFAGSITVSTTSSMCAYVVLNVDSSATAGHTLELQISNPSTQVITGTGSSSPATAVSISDTTTFVVGYLPNKPTLAPTPGFEHMQSTTTTPTLGGFAATDPDGDAVQFQLIIDDDYDLSSPATTTYSFNYPNDAGWASTTFAGGATTTYQIQSSDELVVGETYWWAVRAKDPLNRNEWSATSTPRAITISDALTVPEWFQTTDMQFATTTTIVNGTTTGSDSVEIDNLSQPITLLNAWSLGTTKTISAGTDRLLVVAIYDEDNAVANVGSATYGGQTLTEIYDQTVGAGTSGSLWVGYLPESRIASSSGTTIAVTWADGSPAAGDVIYSSAVFEGVNQDNPVRGYSPNALTSGGSIAPTASSTVYAGDMVFYAVGAGDGVTYTPHTGYTEGTDNNTCGGGCSSATAYKSISANGTELPTATLSVSANRVAMTLVVLQARARATIMSPEVDFDWVGNQNDWGEVSWNVNESAVGDTRLQVYYGTSTACSAIVPNSALSGNSVGFVSTSSPLNISSLSTSTSLYNKICLKMTLREGTGETSPKLTDWNISWERQPVFNQLVYRWYANTATATPTDTWPEGVTGSELSENEAINALYPTKTGDTLRLRMGVAVSSVAANSNSFALQYAEGETCGTDMVWTDVAPMSSTTALWRGYDNAGLSDGATLSSSTLTGTDALESYEEENDSVSLPDSIAVGEQGEWDWVIENGANAGTSYCFRMVGSDGTQFATYTEYPKLVTNISPTIISVYAPFDNEKVASSSPWFEFLGSDPERDLVDYQIQIDNNPDFSSTVIETDSATNLDDFLNLDTPADKTSFNNEERIRYTIPSTLADGTTYWWRVRSIDASGSNTYGEWSTPRSLTRDNGVTVTTWFQTTEAQFDTDTLVGTDATGADLVTFASGSTTGTTTSSAIDFDDVTVGNAWGEFSFTETGSANDILYHIEYYDGDSWELIPDSALTGNSTGYDTSPVILIDLDTETYNEIRLRANLRAGSPTLLEWTVEWGERVAVPTHLLLFDNEKTGTTTPSFTFYSTDPDGDLLEYQFSYSTDNTFATGSTTVNSSTSPGFIDVTDGGDTNPFDSGDTIQYTVQTPLTDNVTYWWRVRAKDPYDGNAYSFWSDPWSFTVATTATTSTWFQTTEEQFNTDALVSLVASTSDSVSTIPAGVTTYNFVGITNPSATHVARYFEVGVSDPTDPPTGDEIDTLTNNGTSAGTPNIRSGIAGYAGDAEATNAQYTAISTSNNTRWTTTDPGAGDQAIFWARFKINEDPSDITQIDVTLEGYQSGTPPGTDKGWFGIWRPGSTTPYWQNLSASQRTSDFNYTGSITSTIGQYLDGNNYLYLIYFNEDDSDPVIVDYVQVQVTVGTADSGTITGNPVDFNDGTGPAWGSFFWNDTEPGTSVAEYQLEYLTGIETWALIPDTDLPGNAAGFSTSTVDLRFLDTGTYNEIRPVGNLVCSGANCPTLNDWTIKWSPGFTITGTAFEYDGTSSTTGGTVAVAVNGVLQSGKTGTISNGSWSIVNVTFFEGDVVTVFVSGALDADEAVAITVYDGSPDMSGMRLQKRHLTIGSDDYGTVTNADISEYDYTDDEDLFFDVSVGNDLTMCADVSCGDAGVVVLATNTYNPGTGADVTTHDFRNNGTFIAGVNSIRVNGSWDNNATTTLTGSTIIFTATSTAESIDSTGALSSTFNNVTFGEGSGTATWTLVTDLDLDGNLAVTYGTLARATATIVVAGNLTTGASGFWNGMGTTTFDGINPGTWTDSNATKQNIGHVVVDGTSKTLLLGSNVTMQSLLIGSNDTFDLSITGHSVSLYEDWINNNTFVPRTGTVNFIATTTNQTITVGGDAFYNLNFNGGGGSWSFTEADLSVTNDFTLATGTVTMPIGTTTIAGSFTNSGGTFAHNNALVYFTGSGAETLTLAGTAFENAFYNVRFTGSGSWTFTEANATTTNNITITQGTVTMPGTTLAIGGDFVNTGGTFVHNSGTIKFTSAAAKTIDTNASFYSLLFAGVGSWSFIDTNVTVLNNFTISGGTTTLPSGTLTLGGSFTNTASTTHNSGTVLFNATTTGKTISTGSSSLYNMTFNSATGGWTITSPATTTNNVTLTALSSFTLASGQTLSVGGVFTNSVGGASTTWTGSTLSLEAGAYTLNTKTTGGDSYGTLRIKANTDIKMWNSSSTLYAVDTTGSLYSQDHSSVDGDLYIFGAYERASGDEYWSYATDFDGTALTASTSRQVDVQFADGATARVTGALFQILGTTSATTTIANQGSGTYTIFASSSTSTLSYYDFDHLGTSGVTLSGAGHVTSLSDGAVTPGVQNGTGFTIASTTINANPNFQIYRVNFSTTTAISATNTAQTDGTPSSYWWFRDSSGNIDGESYDNDTGDPGSIRWDDSSLIINVSGTVYSDDGVTPMATPVCDGATPNITVVVQPGTATSTWCAPADGAYDINVAIVGDVTLTTYLNTNGGEKGVVVTKTPTANISNHDIYANRVITKHEDVLPLTIADMAKFDNSDDADIPFIAATGTTNTLELPFNTELHIASSTIFAPGGDITIHSNASGTSQDGSLHIDDNATLTGSATSTYTLGGSFTMDQGATFTSASTTVIMNATTTGKTITTTSGQEISFNNLQFMGSNGGWNINGNIRALGNIDVATGTVTGTSNITLPYGSMSGNGTVSLGTGTTTIERTNTLGGTTAWTFANLVLGNGSVVGTTTPGSNATTTILGKLTISTAHFLDGNTSVWDFRGAGNVFVENGTFQEDTSMVRYSGTLGSNILSTNYYDLQVNALGSSPTFTGTGLGIMVLGNLSVGGISTTTLTFASNDPALDVNGEVSIAPNGVLIGSDTAVFTVGGSWDNNGTFTGSGGTVTFDNGGTKTIAAGNSSFSNVIINGATGTFTISEHATATTAYTLTNAASFTVGSGVSLAVGGTFTNSIAGANTTWTGSTLHLYGGGNYSINSNSTSDTYETLRIANGTQIRMWGSEAGTYDVHSAGSLYSQDHSGVDGDLYIYGAYTKTSGTDYWNYTTDFDGTVLGSPRNVDVYIQNGSSVLYTGGGLAVVGDTGASTTIQNQGSGTYAFRIGGTASTTWNYYQLRNTDVAGLTFSGTPTISSLSYGDFEVSQNNGTAVTVGGTAIQVKTFVNNYFGVSGASPAYNVTATGTTLNSWKFTSHNGSLAGEAYDVDPGANGGDPGYIVWDNSSTSISVSGNVYSDEVGSISTACDGSNTLKLVVGGATQYTTSCDGDGLGGGTGLYTFTGVSFNIGDSFIVYIDGQPEKAATVSEDNFSTISNFDLYENRVIVRHEGVDPLSIADMSLWDSSDDADIPFAAVDGSPDTLTLPSDKKLIVWTGKTFTPGGNVTVTGGGAGAAYDGTLELYGNATFDATGAESHTVGGSLIMGTGAVLDDETSTFTFTTSGSARTIDTNEYSLYNVVLNGSGSWTVSNSNLDVGNNMTITQGTLTLPTGTTTIGGSFQNTGGTFSQNGGSILFSASTAKTIRQGGSSFGTTTFNGGGSWTYLDTNATTTGDFIIRAGTVTAASGTLTIGHDFINEATFTHNSGTLRLIASTANATITANGSDLNAVTLDGSSNYRFTDTNVALQGTLRILQGSATLATGTMSIAGSFLNTGGSFNNASGTVLFNSSDTGETINPNNSLFHSVSFASAGGGWTIAANATVTANFALTNASNFTLASSTRLYVGGVFTNLVGGGATTWTGSTLVINSGSEYTINTKSVGGDTYHNVLIGSSTALRAWDSTGTITMTDGNSSFYSQDHGGTGGVLYIYGNYVRSIGSDYWSYATDFDGTALGVSPRKAYVYMAANATTTFTGGALNIVGANGFDTQITNQGSGSYGVRIQGGTLNALYYSLENMNASGLTLSGDTTVTSLTEGNFTLSINGGSLITLSSTTLNYNAGLTVVNASFATTTAIAGYNVTLVGTTPSAWTFTSHSGNLSGENYDVDGITDCGSLWWDDSTCLLTKQSAYRWRNNDGGEGVPNSEWFDLDWTKRKRVTVTNFDPITYTNAVVKFTVSYDSDMQADFGDLRFTRDDGVTLINHFIESYTATTAVVWVKVPTLATSTAADIYMYYGEGTVSDASATTTFIAMDNFEDGNISEYSGDTGEFMVDSSGAYERTYRLEASDPTNGKTDFGGMYNNNMVVSQGERLRFLKYIDTGTGSGDEVCTLFGTQNQTQNYAVCLELFGVDRMSLVQDVLHRDTSGTVLASTTVTYSTGWYEVEIDWDTDDTIAVVLSKNGTVVATTSATDSSYTSGGIGYTLWGYHGGWDVYSSRPLLVTEPTTTVGYEQVPGGATWLAALNTPGTGISPGEVARLRFLIENSGLDISAQNFEIDFAPKGIAPSCESVNFNTYVEVPTVSTCGTTATSSICMVASTQVTNLESTTDLLGGDGVFTPGQVVEDSSNMTGDLDIDAGHYTEIEYVLTPTIYTEDSNYCLRVTNAGASFDSYTRIAELQLTFAPNVTSLNFNDGANIILYPGTTTRIYATGTVSDQNGYQDIVSATTTFYQNGLIGGVGYSCTPDNNNCYRAATPVCSFVSCSGNSCDVICSADIYYHANPTNSGTYEGDAWTAYLDVADTSGFTATATSPSIDVEALRAVDANQLVDYGSLEVNANTGSYNATTTFVNIGNVSVDLAIEGTDLSDGGASVIPVTQQRFATTTFTYSACVTCTQLNTSSINYEVDLTKPASTSPSIADQLFWGIAIPYGVAGTPHQGDITFYPIND